MLGFIKKIPYSSNAVMLLVYNVLNVNRLNGTLLKCFQHQK